MLHISKVRSAGWKYNCRQDCLWLERWWVPSSGLSFRLPWGVVRALLNCADGLTGVRAPFGFWKLTSTSSCLRTKCCMSCLARPRTCRMRPFMDLDLPKSMLAPLCPNHIARASSQQPQRYHASTQEQANNTRISFMHSIDISHACMYVKCVVHWTPLRSGE